MAEVAELTKSPRWDSSQWYDFACVYAARQRQERRGSAEVVQLRLLLLHRQRQERDKKQEYADRAMDLLQKAVKAGYNDAAHMAKDTDLDPIRGRDDFKKLIEELAKKSPAKPEPKP